MAAFIASWISTLSAISARFSLALRKLEGMTHAPHRSFLGCNSFFLSLDTRLFVVLSFTQLGEYTRLFAQFFETANGTLDGFVFSDSNSSHNSHHPQSKPTPLFAVVNFSSFGC